MGLMCNTSEPLSVLLAQNLEIRKDFAATARKLEVFFKGGITKIFKAFQNTFCPLFGL